MKRSFITLLFLIFAVPAMAQKISDMPKITGAAVPDSALFPVVDLSETLASSRNKAILASELKSYVNEGTQASNALFVSAGYSGLSSPFYSTITAALADWTSGKIIVLGAETFDEDVELDSIGMILFGSSKEKSIIGNLTITAKDCIVRNLTVSEDYICLCETAIDWFNWIELSDLRILGNVSIGDDDTKCTYLTHFYDCFFHGDYTKSIKYNTVAVRFFNCYAARLANGGGDATDQINIDAVRGRADWYDCARLYFNDITYSTVDDATQLSFHNCIVQIRGDLTTISDNTSTHILSFVAGEYGIFIDPGTITWTFNGKFEFDCFGGKFSYPNIVFNSASESRIVNMIGKGYDNPSVITGSGLNKLYIQKSIFHCSAPGGLAADQDNLWEAFLDE